MYTTFKFRLRCIIAYDNSTEDWATVPVLMTNLMKGNSPQNLAPTTDQPGSPWDSPQQEGTTHLWVSKGTRTQFRPRWRTYWAALCQELDWSLLWKKTLSSSRISTNLKHKHFLKWSFKRGKKGLFTASLKILILRFVCEGSREGGEHTLIFSSMRIKFCSFSLSCYSIEKTIEATS